LGEWKRRTLLGKHFSRRKEMQDYCNLPFEILILINEFASKKKTLPFWAKERCSRGNLARIFKKIKIKNFLYNV